MPPTKLTEKFVAKIPAKISGAYSVRDTDLKGFFVTVEPTGTKSFKIQTDIWEDKRKVKTLRITLGRYPALSVADARTAAMTALANAKRGNYPAARKPQFLGQNSTVEEMGEAYASHLSKKGAAPRTIRDFGIHFEKYLRPYRTIKIGTIKKSTAREIHERLTKDHGPSLANHVLRSLRAAYNYAISMDDENKLTANPVSGVRFHPESPREAVIMPHELPAWWAAAKDLPNPMRGAMHRLGLLSGLRPGTLVQLRREWLDGQFFVIPAEVMKSRRDFMLPMSATMLELVEQAIAYGDIMYRGTPYLFPAQGGKHTTVWRERTLQTGHILRKTYRTIALSVDIPTAQARLLVDHSVSGIEAHYVHPQALRDELLRSQERITAKFMDLLQTTR